MVPLHHGALHGRVAHGCKLTEFAYKWHSTNQILQESWNILSGLAYNADSKNPDDMWDGVRDFHITTWEFGTNFSSYVSSFNFNTNQWAGRFVALSLRLNPRF